MIQFFIDKIKNSIFTKVFMGLMVLSFGIWGVGDVLSPPADPAIAMKAGSFEVRTDELQRRFTGEMNRLRDSLGQQTTPDPALRAAVLNNTVDQLKRTTTTNVAADDFGVFVTRDWMRQRIQEDRTFQDESGKFNQLRFMQILGDNSMNEQMFLDVFERDLRQQVFLQPVGAGAAAPASMVDHLFAYRTETRIADTLLIQADSLPAPKAPSDDDLKKTFDDNVASFTAPEYRKLEAVILLGPDLITPDSFDDEAAQTFYNENSARYRTKETRRVQQLLFETKEQAAAARAKMAPGDGLSAIAQKANVAPPVDLGARPADDAVLLGFGEAAKLPSGQISEPVESALGWHLIETLDVTPEAVTPFEQVKADIRASLAKDKAADMIYDASVKLEDEIAAGTPMADIAKMLGARHLVVDAVDRSGLDPSGVTVETIVEREKLLSAAFRTNKGAESELVDVEGGYFVVKVQDIVPPAPKALALVRPELVTMWERQTRLADAKVIAEQVAAEIGSGSLAQKAENDKRFSYAQMGPITRFGESLKREYIIDSKRVSPDLLERLFKAKVGDIVSAPVVNGYVIARLKEVVPPRAEGEMAAAPTQIKLDVRNAMAQDLLLQFTRALENRYPVTVNQEVVDQLAASRN